MNRTSIIRRILPVGLIFALVLALLPQAALSASTRGVTTTYFRLDTGVTFLWKHSNGVWQKGWEPGSTQTYGTQLTLPKDAKNVKLYKYSGGNFIFDNPSIYLWNPTAYATGKDDYEKNYYAHSANPLTVTGADSYTPASGKLTVTYTATFSDPKNRGIDVKDILADGKKDYIYGLLGSPSQEVIDAMNLLDPSSESYSPNVEGCLWFLPVVIQYDLTEKVEIPDDILDAILDLPRSARVGETYTAADISVVGADLSVDTATLKMREVGKIPWNPVITWPGRGKGQNSGGKKSEKATRPGEFEYQLTVTTKEGKTDTDTKKIKILEEDEEEPLPEEQDPDVDLTAILSLPPKVYEGHSVRASDHSSYSIDGKYYPAAEAYAAGKARNAFSPSREAEASLASITSTEKDITWPKVGDYEVTLRISAGGSSDTDTKPIEVLKTPAIIASLGGRQKQNRKQTLSAHIATNPLYPLRAVWMEITEKSTGETVRLNMNGALQNSANIKTRAIEDEDSDKHFTNLELPFLTKYGETREFSYTIYAEDTRGQTDSVTKDFTVVPDLPPTPEILLPTTFLREKGTNVARIEAADLSHSAEADQGDELERTWYVSWPGPGAPSGFANAKTLSGYEELSFEAGKEIAFDKAGVGPAHVKIFLKDIWTDDTLPEYVRDADYLTAESEVYGTVVNNIAPVVSLSPKPTKSADLLLLAASDTEYVNLLARKNETDAALIEKGIDAKISVRKLSRLPSSVSAFQKTRSNIEGNTLRDFALDGDTLYTLSGTLDIVTGGSSSAAYIAAPYYITAYDAYSDAVKWSVQAPKALADALGSGSAPNHSLGGSGIGQDDESKYLYITQGNKTFLFDKRTGAYVKSFDHAFGRDNYIANNSIYSLRADGIYRYRTTGGAERVFSGEISGESALVGGKLRFFVQLAPYAYMADFDPVTEETVLIRLSGIARNSGNTCAGVDETGAMLVNTPTRTSFYDKAGRLVRNADTNINPIPVKNGEGRITYAASLSSGKEITLCLQDLYTGDSISRVIQRSSESIIVHALYGFDSGDGRVSIQVGKYSNDLGSGWGDSYNHGPGTAGLCTVNMRTGEASYSAHSGYLAYDGGRAEYESDSASLYAVGWSLGSYNVPPPADDAKIKVNSIPRNGDQILAQATASLMTNDAKDIKTVIVAEDYSLGFDVNGAKFRAVLGTVAFAKLSDSGSATLASAIVQTIADAGLATQKTTVIQKAPNAAAGGITRSLALDPQKTYYYEYESNAEDKADRPFSVETETVSVLPDSGNLYVQETYSENFNGGALSKFFGFDTAYTRISDNRLILAKTGSYGGGSTGEFTFSVPRGSQGLLSFDYDAYSGGSKPGGYSGSGPDCAILRIDGVPVFNMIAAYSGDYKRASGSYVHNVLLGEGQHSVSAVASYYYNNTRSTTASSYVIIDNLKFETLGAAQPAIEAWSTKTEDAGGGMTRYTGTFVTPNPVYSYGFYAAEGGGAYAANALFDKIKLRFSASDTTKIRNFSIWYLENGLKTYVTRDSLESASELAQWRTENATAVVVDERPTGEEKEKGALIYKKGQLVAYNIVYTDRENDASKAEFWRYAHTPFNDGEHPDAAVILSKRGETLKVSDKTLSAHIDRFYIDGKYVVEHWQRDNTDRANAGSGAVDYEAFNKYSNTETLTFYIEGGGKAPWVTGIKTNPDPVRESGAYRIEAGVDDLEKDDLTVLIEVYYEGKKVYEYYEENIKADEAGNYPTVITGTAPNAATGNYTVVVTVWDEDGTGLGDHSFTVITEGRIEGEVFHTDLWDENRKRYNLKLFGEEVNRASVFADYTGLAAPRPRGANVFWSGERFMLRACVAGNPLSVRCAINGYPAYATAMTNSGRKTAADEWIYEGSVWQSDMINLWGRTAPVELSFVFTADYEGGITKTHEARVIVDTYEDYRQLHRYY
ncbi:MAG: hypothetical protein LBB57_00395 [Clostridiales Family XIII bacterium]|jgi:hypothetical protein|nr:hypothetical protein [Clostridiales Family XIII bacterium]